MVGRKDKPPNQPAVRQRRAEAMEARVREALRQLVDTSGYRRKEIAEQLGRNQSYMSILLPRSRSQRPPTGLRFAPVFEILDFLGVEAVDFLTSVLEGSTDVGRSAREQGVTSGSPARPSSGELTEQFQRELAAILVKAAADLLSPPAEAELRMASGPRFRDNR